MSCFADDVKVLEALGEQREDIVGTFRDFLRIKSVSGNLEAYEECAKFISSLVEKLVPTAQVKCISPVKGHPIVFVEIPPAVLPPEGKQSPKGILLNSHYDVVPADNSRWTVDPWQAVTRDMESKDDGKSSYRRIFGRGAQDMKCVCIAYLFALARLVHKEAELAKKSADSSALRRRPIFMSFVPDEEIGGRDGMAAWLKSEHFQKEVLPRVACCMDEGLPTEGKCQHAHHEPSPTSDSEGTTNKSTEGDSVSTNESDNSEAPSTPVGGDYDVEETAMAETPREDYFRLKASPEPTRAPPPCREKEADGLSYTVFYGERAVWWVKIRARSATGHASRFSGIGAVDKLFKILQRIMQYREQEFNKAWRMLYQSSLHPSPNSPSAGTTSSEDSSSPIPTLNTNLSETVPPTPTEGEESTQLVPPSESKKDESSQEESDEPKIPGCRALSLPVLGQIMSINVTVLNAGVPRVKGSGGARDTFVRDSALNVIPEQAEMGVDVRVPPHISKAQFLHILHTWAFGPDYKTQDESKRTVDFELLFDPPENRVSSCDPEVSLFYRAIRDGVQASTKGQVVNAIFPAATDGRYLRSIDLPCFGFTPVTNVPILFHDHDEHVTDIELWRSVLVFEEVIGRLSTVPTDES